MSTQSCEKIKVFGRIRPSKEDLAQKVVTIDGNEVTVNLDDDPKSFLFDGFFDEESTQEEVFNGVASRIVHGTLQGYNGTIFAYGQTGSGKTHTMIGPSNTCEVSAGIIPRSLQLLFEQLDKKKEEMPGIFKSTITISFVEIHNENIYDLFVTNDEKLKIGQDYDGNAMVKGVTEIFVKDLNDAMEEVRRGWANRTVAETAMNRASSRSHALVLIKIRTEEVHGSISTARSAFLNLVDLAGSERVSQSKVEGDRLKETTNINKSLLNLKIVIRDLSEKKKNGFINFRNSVLTHILKDSLGGNARTAVMINVHPDKKYYSETLSTLNFAAEVRRIENKVVVNEDLKGDSVIAYKTEIRRLQEEMENIQNKNSEEVGELKRLLNSWMEAAHKYERQLAVARRNAVNAAIVARKDGLAASQAESLWETSMAQVAESIRDVPTTGIRSVLLKEVTEQLNLCMFERDELQTQLDDERKAKGEVQDKLNRYMEGAMSPVRERRLGSSRIGSSSSQEDQYATPSANVSSMLGNPLETSFAGQSTKKQRRMTMYNKPGDRKSTFFKPVLDLEGDDGQTDNTHLETDNSEERREMDLEMKINQREQIIDEKTRENEQLSRLLNDAVKKNSEAEEKVTDAMKACEEEREKVKKFAAELEAMEKTIAEDREKMVELERQESHLNEQLVEANAQVDRLESDMALLKSNHLDEMKELEAKLRNNLSDNEKKEVDLKGEIDRLRCEIDSTVIQLKNKTTEKTEADNVLTMISSRLKSAEEEKSAKMSELESTTAQLEELRAAVENEKKEMEEERRTREEEHEKKVAALEKELEMKKKEVEKEQLKMRQIGETCSSQFTSLQQEMATLRITKDNELRERVAEKEQTIEHWKTVSLQFSGKIDEMKKEFETERTKRLDSEANEKRIKEILQLHANENEELKENVSALGSHNNPKQKLHMISRYVEEKRQLTMRVAQLEAALARHGLALPPPETLTETVEDGGQRDSLASDGGAAPSRRPVRAAASSSTAASAANSKTSVRSTRAATGGRK